MVNDNNKLYCCFLFKQTNNFIKCYNVIYSQYQNLSLYWIDKFTINKVLISFFF